MKTNFAILFLALFLFSCKQKSEKGTVPSIQNLNEVHVKTVPVSTGLEQETIQSVGIVHSEAEAKPSFKTGGVISRTNVQEGDLVRKGQLLATLLMTEIDAQVRQAEEGLSKAERDVNRVKNLYRDSVATLEQLQNTQTMFEVARKTLEIAKFNRNYSSISAPIAGRIVKQIQREGEITGPGMPLFYIMGTGKSDWKVLAGLIDRDWARVGPKDKVEVIFDAYPNQTFAANITDKSAVGGNANGNLEITLKLKNPPSSLAAGMISKVRIQPSTSAKLTTIPIEALVKSSGLQATVFTIENGKAKQLKIEIASILGDKVAVLKGLENVSEVVTTGAMYLEEGDVVKKSN